jgi:membrane protein implicated in regulation of membrane protease activity
MTATQGLQASRLSEGLRAIFNYRYYVEMFEIHYFWFILAAVLVILELLTGTFYLLVLALGCAGGGVAAWLGLGISAQLIVTAMVCIVGWALLRKRQSRHAKGLPAVDSDSAVHFDIGQKIQVASWSVQGQSTVTHRGSQWQAELAEGSRSDPGLFTVVKVVGNKLVLRQID